MKIVILIAFLQLLTDTRAQCPDSFPTIDRESGNCYRLFDTPLSWIDANDECLRHQSHLVTLESEEEVEFIAQLIQNKNTKWFHLGLQVSGSIHQTSNNLATWVDGQLFDPSMPSTVAYDSILLGPFDATGVQFSKGQTSSELKIGFSEAVVGNVTSPHKFICKHNGKIRCLPHDAIGNKTKVATSPWMTPTFCTAKCLVEGYSGYAIVNAEYPPQCFCTDDTSLPEPDDTDICSTKCSQNKWMTCGGTKTAGSNVTSLSFIRELQYMNLSLDDSREMVNCEKIKQNGNIYDFTINGTVCGFGQEDYENPDLACPRYIPGFAHRPDNLPAAFLSADREAYDAFLQQNWTDGSTKEVWCPDGKVFSYRGNQGLLAYCLHGTWILPLETCVDKSDSSVSNLVNINSEDDSVFPFALPLIVAVCTSIIVSAGVIALYMLLHQTYPHERLSSAEEGTTVTRNTEESTKNALAKTAVKTGAAKKEVKPVAAKQEVKPIVAEKEVKPIVAEKEVKSIVAEGGNVTKDKKVEINEALNTEEKQKSLESTILTESVDKKEDEVSTDMFEDAESKDDLRPSASSPAAGAVNGEVFYATESVVDTKAPVLPDPSVGGSYAPVPPTPARMPSTAVPVEPEAEEIAAAKSAEDRKSLDAARASEDEASPTAANSAVDEAEVDLQVESTPPQDDATVNAAASLPESEVSDDAAKPPEESPAE